MFFVFAGWLISLYMAEQLSYSGGSLCQVAALLHSGQLVEVVWTPGRNASWAPLWRTSSQVRLERDPEADWIGRVSQITLAVP